MPWLNIALIVGIALLFPTAYAAKIGAPYVPVRTRAIRKTLEYINLGSDDVFVDLGAGDGKVVLAAADRGARAYGYELSPPIWFVAWMRAVVWAWRRKNKHKPRIYLRNFYRQPLTDATVAYTFLVPGTMERVRQCLAKQHIPRGKYMLVYAFPFKEVLPLHVVREPNCLPVYVYDLQELTKKRKT